MKQKLFSLLLAVVGMIVGNMSGRAVTTTVFSTEAKAVLSVPASTTNMEITSDYATVTGGTMYVTNEQAEAKGLITSNSNALRFTFTNNNTFFKVVLNDALQVGDVVHVNMQGGLKNGAWKGIWLSTQSSRPNSAPDSITTTNSSYTDLTYTIASGDELVGVSTFYIYRAAGATTYLTSMNITRDVLAAPTITTNLPATATVGISNATTFSIVAADATSYQWYKASGTTADVTNDDAIDGATAASYSYSAPAEGTEYIYCVATNDIGSTVSTVCAVTASEYIPITFGLTRPLTAPAEEGAKGTMGANNWITADNTFTLTEIKGSDVQIDTQSRDYTIDNVTYSSTYNYKKQTNTSSFDENHYFGYSFVVPNAKRLNITQVNARLSDASNATWTWKVSVQDESGNELWHTGNKTTTGNGTTTIEINDNALTTALANLSSGTYLAKIYYYQGGTTKDATIDLTFNGNLMDADPEVATVTIPETLTAVKDQSNTITSTVNAYPAVTAYQWYSCDVNGENGVAVENATTSTLTFTPDAVGTEYYYLAATNAAGTANSNVCTVTVQEEADFSDFAAILNNATGTLLESAELTQGTSVNFGIGVDNDGKTIRLAADSPLAFATVSGKYHSDHGMTNLVITTKVSGNVKISVGECTYSSKTIIVKNSNNETVASTVPEATCWKNDKTKVAVLYYEGEATTLTISGMDYCPYIAVEAVEEVPAQYTIDYYDGETKVSTTSIYDGTALGSLPTPTYDSTEKYFIGWFADTDDMGTKALASTVPTASTTYYAVFMDVPTTTAGYYTPQNGTELYGLVQYLGETNPSSAKIFLKNGTYDWGSAAETKLTASNVSIIGESLDGTVWTNVPTQEGLGTATLLYNKGQYNYLQDLTLHNNYPYGNSTGRAASLKDEGNYTICKNVWLYSHQDTYYSHTSGGYFYFNGGKISGCVDYMCGQSRVYYDGVTLSNDNRDTYMTANSELYVFNNCIIENNGSNTYYFGRSWSSVNGGPHCIFINTTLKDNGSHLGTTRWLASGMNDPYVTAGEYGTMNAAGTDITPSSNIVNFTSKSGNVSLETILTAEQAATYTMAYTLDDWAATAASDVEQEAVGNVQLSDGVLSWTGTSDAYLIENNGEFVALVTETTYNVGGFGNYSVRAANGRGGFGEPTYAYEAQGITFAIATGTSATEATSTASSEIEEITEFANLNASANDAAGKANLSVKLNCGTANEAAATVGFTVPAGYVFIPMQATAKVQPISKAAYVSIALSDAVNNVANDAESFADGTITTSTLTFTEEKEYSGNVTLSVYCYDGAETGVTTYRLGTPITIMGILKEATLTLTTTEKMAGYKSFYSADKNYVLDDNTKAFVAVQKDATVVGLRKISAIPANTPVILKTTGVADEPTSDAYYQMTLTVTDEEMALYTGDNLLAVTTGADENLNVLRLGYKEPDGVAFYTWNVQNNTEAGIVYINVSSTAAAKMVFVFVDEDDEEATGIDGIVENDVDDDAAIYNLSGQRMMRSAKGILIKGGRKYVND